MLLSMEPAALAVELELVQVVAHLVQEPEALDLLQEPEVLELVVKLSLMWFIKSPPWWLLVQPEVLELVAAAVAEALEWQSAALDLVPEPVELEDLVLPVALELVQEREREVLLAARVTASMSVVQASAPQPMTWVHTRCPAWLV